MNFSLFYSLQYHDLDRRSNKKKGLVGWLVILVMLVMVRMTPPQQK
jgi:hypothetical protein